MATIFPITRFIKYSVIRNNWQNNLAGVYAVSVGTWQQDLLTVPTDCLVSFTPWNSDMEYRVVIKQLQPNSNASERVELLHITGVEVGDEFLPARTSFVPAGSTISINVDDFGASDDIQFEMQVFYLSGAENGGSL